MTARNIITGDIYEGSKAYISRIIGVDPSTIWRWQYKKKSKFEIYNNYEIRFNNIIREKQKKGFALK